MSRANFIVFIATLVSLAATAGAQRNPTHESFEWIVNDSTFIGVGTISSQSDTTVVNITEVIKGPKTSRVILSPHTYLGLSIAEVGSARIIVFVRGKFDPTEPTETWRLLFANPLEAAHHGVSEGYFSMNLRGFASEKDLLNTARSYVKRFPEPEPATTFFVPKLISAATGVQGQLTVPGGRSFEALAVKMIQNPKSFVPRQSQIFGISKPEYDQQARIESGKLRRMGAFELGNFKSDENIRILKKCLSDPFVEDHWEGSANVYSVRKVAYDILVRWGVSVTKPILYAPIG
ncbi:MAG: hypothetical protein JST12_16535 [Armatimonadetes bacterium]|nr:hypothetical protein [Armatimonadota bacterium]